MTSAIRVRSSRLRSLSRGGRRVPQRGHVGDAAARARPGAGSGGWAWRAAVSAGLGLGEGGQAGLPAGLEAAGDQPVLRFAGVERPLGAVGFVAGAFDGQLGGPAGAVAAVGDLVGGGQRQRDLVGVQRGQQPLGDRVVDGGRGAPSGRSGWRLVGAGVSTRRRGRGRGGSGWTSAARSDPQTMMP